MNGYAGNILMLDLTRRKAGIIPTGKYEQWMGRHGMGSAIFFDLVKDKAVDGFDPSNVVTLMTSPLSGTLVPGASARTEVQGIGVQSYPIGWFTRSNFGGRFAAMLKFAGWDGVAVQGKADRPVWIDIRDGKDTWKCQEAIWGYVAGKGKYGDWVSPAGEDNGQTTQRPAVVAIGPAGENLSRVACTGCHSACRATYDDALGNEASCIASVFYGAAHSLDIQRHASDLIDRHGLNAAEMNLGLMYIWMLWRFKQPNSRRIPKCPLDFRKYGSKEFVEQFVRMVAHGDDGNGKKSEFGRDISGGFVRAAEKWGRRETDLNNGMLQFPYWGLPIHKEPRAQVYWGYGTILGDRDINEHCFDWLKHMASGIKSRGVNPPLKAEVAARLITGRMVPYQGRHRDMVHFADIVYKQMGGPFVDVPNAYLPGCENGKWDYYGYSRRTLSREKFDEFKTRFYKFHDWDPGSGFPTREALAPLGPGYVADELESNGKLGKG